MRPMIDADLMGQNNICRCILSLKYFLLMKIIVFIFKNNFLHIEQGGFMGDTEKFIEVYGNFKMRKLTEDDLEQFNGLLRYAFQITMEDLLLTG